MVNKCSAVGCKTGYNNVIPHGVTLHSFPKSPRKRAKWCAVMHRENFEPTASSRICSLHFRESDFVTERMDKNKQRRKNETTSKLAKRYLRSNAVPSRFPNLPSYFSFESTPSRDEPSTSSVRLDKENERILTSIDDFEKADVIDNLLTLKLKFEACTSTPGNFVIYPMHDDDQLVFTNSVFHGKAFSVSSHVVVKQDLSFEAFKDNCKCNEKEYRSQMQFPNQIKRFSDFVNLLAYLNAKKSVSPIKFVVSLLENFIENADMEEPQFKKLNFLIEQLALVEEKEQNRCYSKKTLALSVMLKMHSTSCYEAILKNHMLTLPSVSSLRRICQGFDTESQSAMRSYLMEKRKKLNDMESVVVLMFDEMYVYQTIDFSSNTFYGLASDKNEPATTILTFMIKSLSAKYSDVVGFFPLCGFSVEILSKFFKNIMSLIIDCGFDCVCAIADNHPINRSFFKSLGNGELCYAVDNPCDSERRLFLMIDPTHNFKNVFNIFQKRECIELPVTDTFEKVSANFSNIKELFRIEKCMGLRMAYKLNDKVLNPTTINRTSVMLAASVFHDSTVNALKYYAIHHGKLHWMDTAKFVEIINDLWKMINIKTKDIGHRKKDEKRLPFESADDERLILLKNYEDLFQASYQLPGKKKLSNETLSALILMCQTMRHLVPHLLEKGFKYVLLGYLQSDPLEKRFGEYRQMSGSNYFLAVKQVVESERKIKIISLLKHTGITVSHLRVLTPKESLTDDDIGTFDVDDSVVFNEDISKNEIAIICYVAGYIGFSMCKRLKCDSCENLFVSDHRLPEVETSEETEFISLMTRGGLKSPSDQLFMICKCIYTSFIALQSSQKWFDFLRVRDPASALAGVSLSYIHNSPFSSVLDCSCSKGHSFKDFFPRIAKCFFNTLAKNYVHSVSQQKNAATVSKPKVRKLMSSK